MNLDLSMFLRLNGARKIGIGTSFALPVVSRWGVTFVIVFYTRSKIQVCGWAMISCTYGSQQIENGSTRSDSQLVSLLIAAGVGAPSCMIGVGVPFLRRAEEKRLLNVPHYIKVGVHIENDSDFIEWRWIGCINSRRELWLVQDLNRRMFAVFGPLSCEGVMRI